MIALLIFTRRADIMGQFANGRLTNIAAMVATAAVLLLNVILILQTSGVPIPGLPA
jgi:manganese transport protein